MEGAVDLNWDLTRLAVFWVWFTCWLKLGDAGAVGLWNWLVTMGSAPSTRFVLASAIFCGDIIAHLEFLSRLQLYYPLRTQVLMPTVFFSAPCVVWLCTTAAAIRIMSLLFAEFRSHSTRFRPLRNILAAPALTLIDADLTPASILFAMSELGRGRSG
jgi:hypothetical protein